MAAQSLLNKLLGDASRAPPAPARSGPADARTALDSLLQAAAAVGPPPQPLPARPRAASSAFRPQAGASSELKRPLTQSSGSLGDPEPLSVSVQRPVSMLVPPRAQDRRRFIPPDDRDGASRLSQQTDVADFRPVSRLAGGSVTVDEEARPLPSHSPTFSSMQRARVTALKRERAATQRVRIAQELERFHHGALFDSAPGPAPGESVRERTADRYQRPSFPLSAPSPSALAEAVEQSALTGNTSVMAGRGATPSNSMVSEVRAWGVEWGLRDNPASPEAVPSVDTQGAWGELRDPRPTSALSLQHRTGDTGVALTPFRPDSQLQREAPPPPPPFSQSKAAERSRNRYRHVKSKLRRVTQDWVSRRRPGANAMAIAVVQEPPPVQERPPPRSDRLRAIASQQARQVQMERAISDASTRQLLRQLPPAFQAAACREYSSLLPPEARPLPAEQELPHRAPGTVQNGEEKALRRPTSRRRASSTPRTSGYARQHDAPRQHQAPQQPRNRPLQASLEILDKRIAEAERVAKTESLVEQAPLPPLEDLLAREDGMFGRLEPIDPVVAETDGDELLDGEAVALRALLHPSEADDAVLLAHLVRTQHLCQGTPTRGTPVKPVKPKPTMDQPPSFLERVASSSLHRHTAVAPVEWRPRVPPPAPPTEHQVPVRTVSPVSEESDSWEDVESEKHAAWDRALAAAAQDAKSVALRLQQSS
jgi:hypothetical protein